MALVSVKNIVKTWPAGKGSFSFNKRRIHAVNGISFDIFEGETLGIVGESGCGKSTTGRLVNRLLEPDSGEIFFENIKINTLNKKEMLPIRRQISMVFQDPYSSLDPRMRVENIIAEPLNIHKNLRASERKKAVYELMEITGISADYGLRYPHEFSGGQRQRIGIARALILHPKLVIADEPISSLDVSIRAQILNLMQNLQKEFSLTYLFISHDLSIVEVIADRVAVMYLGHIVEIGNKEDIYKNPKHPYTRALLDAIPVPDPRQKSQKQILQGEIPGNMEFPIGCPFKTRCPNVRDECMTGSIPATDLGGGHFISCLDIN